MNVVGGQPDGQSASKEENANTDAKALERSTQAMHPPIGLWRHVKSKRTLSQVIQALA